MLRRSPQLTFRTPLLLAVAALVVMVGAGGASSDPGGQPHRDHDHGHWFEQSCAAAPDGYASCGAQVVTDSAGIPLATGTPPAGALGPAQFAGAYSLPASTATATIGIVDAYDDPNIESDLANFSSQYKLPACTTTNGCFKKVNQTGGTSYPARNSGWALEDRAFRCRDGPRELSDLQDPARRGELGLLRQPRNCRERGGHPRCEGRLQLLGWQRVVG